ncbi:MAG: hypothetical protein R3C14_50405 [Caldilineaceae bacterium]
MIQTILGDWNVAMEQQLRAENPRVVAALAQVVLRQRPRHLATYQRLLRACWLERRWEEGEEWGRRLLRADPNNPFAWRALALASEQQEARAQAHAIWQRALEMDPYAPAIRAGLSRTSLLTAGHGALGEEQPVIMLNLACLATLYMRGLRWELADQTYRRLLQADPRRVDFQVGLMVARWQQQARQSAYRMARQLTERHPHLLLAWIVLQALGDDNDRALAQDPILTMDPDGDFASSWLGLHYEGHAHTLDVSKAEAELLQTHLLE